MVQYGHNLGFAERSSHLMANDLLACKISYLKRHTRESELESEPGKNHSSIINSERLQVRKI